MEALVQSASKKERCSGVIKQATPILKTLYHSQNDAIKVRALVVSVTPLHALQEAVIAHMCTRLCQLGIYCRVFVNWVLLVVVMRVLKPLLTDPLKRYQRLVASIKSDIKLHFPFDLG